MANAQTKWRIEGEYFESCNCEVLCPCILTNAQARPTEGHCDAVVAWQISKGAFGATDLAGLRAVIAIYAPGPMAQGNWTVAVYVDERGSVVQRAALEAIFTGAAGGPLNAFAPLMSKKLPAKAVPITFSITGATRKLSIAGISDITVEGIEGAGKKTVWLDNVSHFANTRLAAARGTASRFNDQGLNFNNTGRNGHFAPVSWSN
ncbi:MAG: DUF1326 domain-containing protein [Candidatus Binataceae bacterium]